MSRIYLSIICPSHLDRWPWPIFGQLKEQVNRVNVNGPVAEFLSIVDNGSGSTGDKLNLLYAAARGEYIAAIGDDDVIYPNYVRALVEAVIEHDGVDLISFDHDYFVNDEYFGMTFVSKDFKDKQVDEGFYRQPTPKCAIRADICKAFTCPSISDKEDQKMSEWLGKEGRLKTEHRIERPIYMHTWNTTNPEWRKKQAKAWERA